MVAKKTGLYISPVTQPIIERIMQEKGFSNISPAINFIVQEYDKLTKQSNEPPQPEVVEEKVKQDLSSWFVQEDKQ